jgi:hypothetical protein
MGSWSLRADGIFEYWSPETFVNFGFDPSQGIPTLTQWLAALQPDGRDLLTRTIDKMFREGVRGDVRYSVPSLTLLCMSSRPFPSRRS